MKIRKLTDIKNLKNKRVLVRVDFNVPVKDGRVANNQRILLSIPTIEYLLKKKAQVVLLTHLGRPVGYNGKENGEYDKKFDLGPVAEKLGELIKKKIKLVSDFNSPISNYFVLAEKEVEKMAEGDIIMLENIRFFPDEAKDIKVLSKDLAKLADIFVLDGFAVAHRGAASVSGVAKLLPSYAGLLLTQELEGLSHVTEKPKKPFVAIIGGVKCETKIPVLNNFLKKASYILVGGGVVNTYLWAKGNKVGASVIDKDFKKEILKICVNKKIILPVDVVVGKLDGSGAHIVLTDKKINLSAAEAILDIGPRTTQLFAKYIKKANTLVMNGALGYFEQSPYQHGTYAISRLFAARSRGKAFGVAGGGETVQILQKLGIMDDVDLVSTGGGAMLEYLGGQKLPGVQAVTKK